MPISTGTRTTTRTRPRLPNRCIMRTQSRVLMAPPLLPLKLTTRRPLVRKTRRKSVVAAKRKAARGTRKSTTPPKAIKIVSSLNTESLMLVFFYFVFFRYESLVLFLMYILYIVVMYFNKRLEQFFYQYLHTLSGGRIGDHSRTLPEQNERQALLESEKVDRSGSVDHNTIPKEIESSFNSQGNRSLEKSADHKDCKTLERFWFHSSARTPPPLQKTLLHLRQINKLHTAFKCHDINMRVFGKKTCFANLKAFGNLSLQYSHTSMASSRHVPPIPIVKSLNLNFLCVTSTYVHCVDRQKSYL